MPYCFSVLGHNKNLARPRGKRPAVDSRWLLPSSLAQLWAKPLWFASCWKALAVRLAHLSPPAGGFCRRGCLLFLRASSLVMARLHFQLLVVSSGRPVTTSNGRGSGRSMNSLLSEPMDLFEAGSLTLSFCRFRRPLEPSSKPAFASHRSCIRDRPRRSRIALRLFHGNRQGEHVFPT